MKDLVSVIIPTYKRSECLLRAIESVLSQTYKKIEIIVVDDNDEDSVYRKENESKLDKYISTNKIVYVKHKKNLNGANARNTGIKVAKGFYITFLDDDDYFLPSRIEKFVNLLKDNKMYDGAYSSVIFEDKEGIITNLFHAYYSDNLQKIVLSGKGFFGTGSNMFFKKSAIDRIGLFDVEFRRHQDLEYMVRFLQFYKILNVDDFLVVKSNMDCINNPNYQVLYDTKEKYLKKFDYIIKKYDIDSQKDIYVSNLYGLYYNATFREKQKLIKKLELYGENKFNIYFKSLKVSIKSKLKSIKLIRIMYMYIIGAKKYKKILSELKELFNNNLLNN